jgi:hypothetical protein
MPRHTGPRKLAGPIILFGVIFLTTAFLAHARHRILTTRFDEAAQQHTVRDADYPARLGRITPLQPKADARAKPYQVKQVRTLITRHRLGFDEQG